MAWEKITLDLPALIWCPCPNEKAAVTLVDCLLDEGLIACGNITPAIRSRFIWQGEKHDSQEVGVLMKTHADLLDRACDRAAQLHPYEEPVVVGWNSDKAPAVTQAWIGSSLEQETKS